MIRKWAALFYLYLNLGEHMGKNRWLRNGLVYLLIVIGVIVIFYTLIPTFGDTNEMPLSEVISRAANQEISEIIVDGKKLTVIPRITGGAGDSFDNFTVGRCARVPLSPGELRCRGVCLVMVIFHGASCEEGQ